MSALSFKQARFVDEYLVDGNGSRAALAAGYGKAGARVAACRVLANANARAAIEARQAADGERLQIDREHVIAGLVAAFELAKQNREPIGMVSACRELGRLLGLYPSGRRTVEVTASATAADKGRWEAMTDAELMAVMAAVAG
jgi:hypothetical protein